MLVFGHHATPRLKKNNLLLFFVLSKRICSGILIWKALAYQYLSIKNLKSQLNCIKRQLREKLQCGAGSSSFQCYRACVLGDMWYISLFAKILQREGWGKEKSRRKKLTSVVMSLQGKRRQILPFVEGIHVLWLVKLHVNWINVSVKSR